MPPSRRVSCRLSALLLGVATCAGRSSGWPADGGRPRDPRPCPPHLAAGGGVEVWGRGGLPRRRGVVWGVVVPGGRGASRRGSPPAPVPNTYEDPRCQETNLPYERIFPFFSAGVQAERRSPLATCSVFISVGWCIIVTAPNTY